MDFNYPALLHRFINSKKRYNILKGGRSCVHGDTMIDTPKGKIKIKDFKGGSVIVFDGNKRTVSYASKSVKYPKEQLYKITFSNGKSIITTAKHKFLTTSGWNELFDTESASFLHFPSTYPNLSSSISDTFLSMSYEDAPHYLRKLLSCLYHYLMDYHLYDELPRQGVKTYRDVLQRLADVSIHTLHDCEKDDSEILLKDILCLLSCLLSSFDCVQEKVVQNFEEQGNYIYDRFSVLLSEISRLYMQSREKKNLPLLVQEFSKLLLDFLPDINQDKILQKVFGIIFFDIDDKSLSSSFVRMPDHHSNFLKISQIEKHSIDNFYDIFVPFYNNYIVDGIVNHNSGKSWFLATKFLVDMMTKPRRDLLCVREKQNTLAESNHKLFKSLILNHKLPFTILNDKITSNINGAEILFIGMNKTTEGNVKSYENFLDCWIEEAQTILESSLEILDPTIRANGSKLYFSLNPLSGTADKLEDELFLYLENNVDKNDIDTEHINYLDNPFCPDTTIKMANSMKEKNYDLYKHVWLGEPMPAGLKVIDISRFKTYNPRVLPQMDYRIIVCDTAMKDKEANDNSVFQVWGKGKDGGAYLIDLMKGKWLAPELKRRLKAMWWSHNDKTEFDERVYGSLRAVHIEDKVSGTYLIQEIQNEMQIPVIPIERTNRKDKAERVMDILDSIYAGYVYIPEATQITPWVNDFLRECSAFTRDNKHKHDDQVDAMVDGIRLILQANRKGGISTENIFSDLYE